MSSKAGAKFTKYYSLRNLCLDFWLAMGLGLEAKRVVGAGEVGVRGTLKPSPGGNTVKRRHIYLFI